eukprot:TRINITY_DN6667_c0_g3_i1.p4 TRINITY_DN6667_c0_g3~~TRINITY_DN6667_c0_g3_i1.p4  ORF type:complete len:205 (-),score=4.20 TRINITY_DN6667_c0_g3_i1:898-1512(-)
MPSIDRPFTSDEKAIMQTYIERFYGVFIQRCADGRNTTSEKIDEIGQGRVWSGENAIGINLVDKIGGIDEAIAIAKNMANLENYRIVELPEVLPFPEQLIKDLTENASARVGKLLLGEEYELIKTVKALQTAYPIQARIPFDINLNQCLSIKLTSALRLSQKQSFTKSKLLDFYDFASLEFELYISNTQFMDRLYLVLAKDSGA